MRRISIVMVAIWFFATLIAIGGIGGIVRGCQRDDRNTAIAAQQRELDILVIAEGKTAADPLRASLFFAAVKDRLAEPKYGITGTVPLFALAETLKKSTPEALSAVDQSKGWEPVRALADNPLFADAQAAAKKYPLDDVLAGKATPSVGFVVDSPLPFWQWDFWRTYYLIFSAIFVAGFGLTAYLGYGQHPVTQYPWRRVDAVVMVASAAPVSLPAIALYGLFRLLTSEWTKTYGRVRSFVISAAYQLRIVRKLPAPVVEAVEYHGAAAETPPVVVVRNATPAADVQWYVVKRGAFLGIEHLLAAAKVEVYPISIRIPIEENGFAVAAETLAAFEAVLGPLAANPLNQETDIERTVLRTYKVDIGEVRVEKMESKANGNRMRWIAQTVSARLGGISILVNSPDDPAQPPEGARRDQTVLLMHCATPAAVATKTRIRRLYGHDLEEPIEGIEPDPDRGVIIRDPDGTPVAQVVGSTVYTLVYNLLTQGTDWSLETLARIVLEAVTVCLVQPAQEEENDETRMSAWRRALDVQRQGYVDLSFGRFEAKQRTLKEAIAEKEKEVVDAGETIRKALSAKKKKDSELAAFMAKDWPTERERLGTEFDQLVASPYVISVEAKDSAIDVYTKTIHIDWRGKRYRVGRFKVSLADNGKIEIANIANTATGTRYEHPHIRDSRATCWGNMHATVMELMGERQYAVVITMIYRFLESYNPHSGVADIGHWKEEQDA